MEATNKSIKQWLRKNDGFRKHFFEGGRVSSFAALYDSGLSSSARIVYIHLCSILRPSYSQMEMNREEISQALGLTLKEIEECLKELDEAGYIWDDDGCWDIFHSRALRLDIPFAMKYLGVSEKEVGELIKNGNLSISEGDGINPNALFYVKRYKVLKTAYRLQNAWWRSLERIYG